MQRALNECDAGKRAKSDFRAGSRRSRANFSANRAKSSRLKDEIEKKGMLMNPDQRQSLQDQYVAKAKDFHHEYKDARDELQAKDNEITGRIVHDLAQIIRKLGERDGYTIVLGEGIDPVGHASNRHHRSGNPRLQRDPRQDRNSCVKMESSVAPGRRRRRAVQPPLGDFGSAAARRSTISK